MAGKYGDCEDYALAKRSALLQAGWPKDKLVVLVTLVRILRHQLLRRQCEQDWLMVRLIKQMLI